MAHYVVLLRQEKNDSEADAAKAARASRIGLLESPDDELILDEWQLPCASDGWVTDTTKMWSTVSITVSHIWEVTLPSVQSTYVYICWTVY